MHRPNQASAVGWVRRHCENHRAAYKRYKHQGWRPLADLNPKDKPGAEFGAGVHQLLDAASVAKPLTSWAHITRVSRLAGPGR